MPDFFPYGLQLKSLLVGSMLTESDLKRCLEQRGVFVPSSDKDTTVPLLMTLLLSPAEFGGLKQNQLTHEDNLKHFTRYLEFSTNDYSLLEVLENNNLNRDIFPIHRNYEVTNAPAFRGNTDRIEMEYEIERKNPTKDWSEAKTMHTGRVIIEKAGRKAKLQVEWSAPETKDLSNRILGDIRRQIVAKGFAANDARLESIVANTFSNAERTHRLLAFTAGDPSGKLKLSKVSNVNFGPDTTVERLPESIAWMQKHVWSMLVKGEGLHTLDYFTKEEYRSCLILDMVEASFDFEFKGSKGTCVVVYGFPGYLKNPAHATEFEASPGRISWSRKSAGGGKKAATFPSKQATARYILSIFEDMKDQIFTATSMGEVAATVEQKTPTSK